MKKEKCKQLCVIDKKTMLFMIKKITNKNT